MEYEGFNFKPFGFDHEVSDLLEFLHCMDRLKTISDAFEHFLPMFPKAARDIAKGLAFLHSNDIVHRDLKPGNVLVSNKHYLNETMTSDQFADLYCKEPVNCKLTDLAKAALFCCKHQR